MNRDHEPVLRGTAYDISRANLLGSAGIDECDLAYALAKASCSKTDYADVYLQHSLSESWTLEEGAVKKGTFVADRGFGLRTVRGDDTAFATSQVIDRNAVNEAAEMVRRASLDGSSVQTIDSGMLSAYRLSPYYVLDDPLSSVDAKAKTALLESVDRIARAHDPRVVEVVAVVRATYENIFVMRNDGHCAADVRPLIQLGVQVQVAHAGKRESAGGSMGGRTTYSALNDDAVRKMVEGLVERALLKLDARPAPAGTMPVVIGPGWNGVLLHEAVGHGLEGDFNRRGSSAFSGRIGERVAARGVTIVDDGTLIGGRGSLNIDDEGHPSQRTVLIDDGVLVGYMQDSINARLMKVDPTGNARRESYRVLPMPRMTNTYMPAGDREPEEIVESVKQGIYVANLAGGQVDITSGRFVFSASEAFLIENGRLTAPVKGATIIGDGPECLKRVSLIGNDSMLDPGMGICGKAGQSVPVGVGQPTLRLDAMTVGGTH